MSTDEIISLLMTAWEEGYEAGDDHRCMLDPRDKWEAWDESDTARWVMELKEKERSA